MQNSKIKISTKNSKLRGMNAHWVALPQCMGYLIEVCISKGTIYLSLDTSS
jgi:hypothetical protein